MESILKSDIFFFVTTILAVIVGILIIWALIYVVIMVKTAKKISQRAQQLFNATSDDVDQFRSNLKQGKVNWMNVIGSFIPKKKSGPKKQNSRVKVICLFVGLSASGGQVGNDKGNGLPREYPRNDKGFRSPMSTLPEAGRSGMTEETGMTREITRSRALR